MYGPAGYVDGEGNVVRKSWSEDEESAPGMTPIGMTSSNSYYCT